MKGCFGPLFLLCGVLLPFIAWFVEVTTRICTSVFFDPLPTPLHQLLWLLVPLSNLWIYLRLYRGNTVSRGLGLVSGMAQGVLLAYTVLFLPLVPLSIIAVIAYGLGFCSLSPLLALPVTLVAFRRVQPRPHARFPGIALAVLLLAVGELPEAITYAGLHLAAGAAPERGLQILRDHGDRELMLKACYQKPEWNNSPVGMIAAQGGPPEPEEARKIFYRALGVPFNAYPPPKSAERLFLDDEAGWDWEWDADLAGEEVGRRFRALSLAESDLRARVDSTGSTVLWTWDLTFANGRAQQREARCQLLLPPHGVVSGAKLWVKGEPRKALIASRAKARQAYEQVVSQSRDPLLVTTKGPDRVLVQCFPVPPEGEMHIQLAITAPLLVGEKTALMKPPAILERNFALTEGHEVAVECPLHHTGLPAEVAARGLTSPELGDWITRPVLPQLWSKDLTGGFTQATWSPVRPGAPRWLVLDGSASMQPYRADVAAALRAWKPSGPVTVLLADDQVRNLGDNLEEAAKAWEAAPLVGGQDAVPALLQAKDGEVLWVHGPQPVLLADLAPLRERAHDILSLAVTPGPNRVLDDLGCVEAVRTGPLREDLPPRTWQQLALGRSQTAGELAKVDDLSRLWAAQECAHGGPDALKLAVAYHLVTPVSGAVVLESEEQERRAGLRPGEFDEIPVVPEPSVVVLLTALGVFAGVWRLRR